MIICVQKISRWTEVKIPKGAEAQAGTHFVINEEALKNHPDYVVLPDTPLLSARFRHEWVLRRAFRPYVPQPDSTPMPDHAKNQEERAKLYSVYLRPWVLERRDASSAVPHITELNLVPASHLCVRTGWSINDNTPFVFRRVRCKSAHSIDRSFVCAWRNYIRGRIVSKHAKRMITQFMAACCGKSKTEDMILGHQSMEPSEAEMNEHCSMSLQFVHQVLKEASNFKSNVKKMSNEDDDVNEVNLSEQMKCSLKLGSALWSLDSTTWGDAVVGVNGHHKMITVDSSAKKQQEKAKINVVIREKVYAQLFIKSAEVWFKKIQNENIKPNTEQLKYLHDIRDRCLQESQELQAHATKGKVSITSEPYRKGLLGPPGTGKSECLRWTRRFFEEVLGWTHTVQFQLLAPQHTMALLIGGGTVHWFGQVPINATGMQEKAGKKGEQEVNELYERTQSLRWLLIDEIEALAAVVLGTFHSNLCQAMSRSPYAKRQDGSRRPFGGVNVSMSGDWWQLPPVKKIGFYSNPFVSDMDYMENVAMAFFWRSTIDGLQGTHELVQSNRTTDVWLREVLQQDREGRESWEVYCFTHGLPTKNVGTWLPSTSKPTCGNEECATLHDDWDRQRRDGFTWDARRSRECSLCKKERQRRCRVLYQGGANDEMHMQEPFAHAPYIHPWNAPKYHAQQLRAVGFAKATNQRLLWIVARDWPLASGDEKINAQRIEKLRSQFLHLHDKKTAGIMGLFPAILNLPVRLTQTENASIGAVKNARGTLVGWTLTDVEDARLQSLSEQEVVLKQRPLQLLIKLKAPIGKLNDGYGEGVYCMKPRTRTWSRDNAGYAKVSRSWNPWEFPSSSYECV